MLRFRFRAWRYDEYEDESDHDDDHGDEDIVIHVSPFVGSSFMFELNYGTLNPKRNPEP